MKAISGYIDQIRQICSNNRVKSLFAFGSVTTDRFRPESDIDLLVEINESDPLVYAENYFSLKFQLEQLLKRPIDLLEAKAIKNAFLKDEIDKSKVALYGK